MDLGISAPDRYWRGAVMPGEGSRGPETANVTDLTPELRRISVRIPDDLLVTETGAEVLSSALPLDMDGLERWTGTCSRA
jgi:hypothetical protein